MNRNVADNPGLEILVVEDDPPMRTLLADGLALDGHRVATAQSCRQAQAMLRQQNVDLVLLDLNLPDTSGYGLLREIRHGDCSEGAIDPNLPVIVLSGRAAEIDRLRGFELGCDDFVVKPYSFAELRGRIAAVVRRASRAAAPQQLLFGELRIDLRSREVWLADRLVEVTGKEYGLLTQLAVDPLRVFTKRELLFAVWGHNDTGSTRTLDSHACRLRRKLAGGCARYVINVWGTGYRLLEGGRADGGAR